MILSERRWPPNKDRLEYRDLLEEWGAWEDPEGFGSNEREHQDDNDTPGNDIEQDTAGEMEGWLHGWFFLEDRPAYEIMLVSVVVWC
jgi:hypothetical protein